MPRNTDRDELGRIRERFLEVNQAGTKIDANTTLIEWIDAFLDTGAQGLTEVLESHATDRVFGQVAIQVFRLPITGMDFLDVQRQMLYALAAANVIDPPDDVLYPAEKDPAPNSNTGLTSDDPPPSGAGVGYKRSANGKFLSHRDGI